MSALHVLAWLAVSGAVSILAGKFLRHRLRSTEPSCCPSCAILIRQLAEQDEHIAGLKRANNAYHQANVGLAAKVSRLEARRRERAS